MAKRYYLAYGSNLNMAQMKLRCPTAKPVGTAVIENNVLTFRGSGSGYYLTIEPKIGGKVPVGVWANDTSCHPVTAADEAALDHYEGYPMFYFKSEITLDVTPFNSETAQTTKAFVYFMRESELGLPSDCYFQTCLDGYKDFGFDKRILKRTLDRVRRVLDERKHKRQN